MSTVRKLKVTSPVTVDGRNLQYDEDKKPMYTESIVELSAKKDFMALNNKLPDHLKKKLEEVEVEEEIPQRADKVLTDKIAETLAAKDLQIDSLKQEVIDAKIAAKDDRIAELERQLALAKTSTTPVITGEEKVKIKDPATK